MNAQEAKGIVAQDEYCYTFSEDLSLEEILSQYQELTGHEVRVERMSGRDYMAWMKGRAERLRKEISTLQYLRDCLEDGDIRQLNYHRILGDRVLHLEDTKKTANFTRHEHLTFVGMDCELMIPLVGHDGEDSMSTIVNEPVPSACAPWRCWEKHPAIYHQDAIPNDAQEILFIRGEAILMEASVELNRVCTLLLEMGCAGMADGLASILVGTQENLQNLIEGTDGERTDGQDGSN